jgi:hypothetical protein
MFASHCWCGAIGLCTRPNHCDSTEYSTARDGRNQVQPIEMGACYNRNEQQYVHAVASRLMRTNLGNSDDNIEC